MSTDYKGKIMYSMTQAKFNELREANGGKLPAQYANSYVYTDAEDVNLSQMRTKILWTNPNPNSSFASQNIVLSSGDYAYLLLFYKTSYDSNAVISKIFPKGYGTALDISEVFTGDYVSVNRCRVITRNSDTSLTIGNCQTGVLRNGGGTERYLTDNAMLVPIQIIGLYKQPSMIYTGAELHEGNGISIEDGVISSNVKDWVNFTNAFDLSIGTSDVQNDISGLITDYDPNGEYETIIRIAGENDTSSNGNVSVYSDVVTLGINSVFARGGDNTYKVNIFTMPFKRYIYCSKTNFSSSSSVRIYGYRRIK